MMKPKPIHKDILDLIIKAHPKITAGDAAIRYNKIKKALEKLESNEKK